MRAVVITAPGHPDVLQLRDVVRPQPGAREILVRVHATAVNRADLMQRLGHYPAPPGWPQDIPGLEYAGVIEECGADVRRWRGGERVLGIVGGGSYAEYVVVHEAEAMLVPDVLSLEAAAAIPEAFLTAYDALRVRLQVPLSSENNATVLIHAVASGVGTAALQLAHQMGLRVFGTARSAWKLERLADVAPATLIDVSTEDFVEIVRAQTGGANYIVDLVGGSYLEKNIAVAAQMARIVVVGLVAGARATLDMRALLNKRLTLVGTVLRARSLDEKIEAAQLFEREAMPWLAHQQIRPVIDRVLPMSEAAEAHRLAEANEIVGKVVLTW
ncbi:MAG TPA: NAD(P)H-quinone oxidoreductase [Longimicrobiales bacterium]